VLYRIKINIYAILKYFSQKTSYICARLAFHHYSKFIREYCNNHRFVPSLTILISFKLILNRSHSFGSYIIILYNFLKFAFTTIFILHNNITRKSIIPKVRCYLKNFNCFFVTGFWFYFTLLCSTFQFSLTLLVHYRCIINIFPLEVGPLYSNQMILLICIKINLNYTWLLQSMMNLFKFIFLGLIVFVHHY